MEASGKTCQATTKSGARCGGYAVEGSDFCFAHAPECGRERAEARRRGGQARMIPKVSGEPVGIVTLADVLRLVNAVIVDTWELENSATRSRALLACGELAVKALQAGEVEARLFALETALRLRQERRP